MGWAFLVYYQIFLEKISPKWFIKDEMFIQLILLYIHETHPLITILRPINIKAYNVNK